MVKSWNLYNNKGGYVHIYAKDMSEVYGNLGEYGVSSELRDSIGESR